MSRLFLTDILPFNLDKTQLVLGCFQDKHGQGQGQILSTVLTQQCFSMRHNICEEHSFLQGKRSTEDRQGIVGFPLNFNGVSQEQTQNSCA